MREYEIEVLGGIMGGIESGFVLNSLSEKHILFFCRDLIAPVRELIIAPFICYVRTISHDSKSNA